MITPALFRTASSAWLQMFARIAALFTGKYFKTARFYQLCGEYAHKRRQYDSLGDEGGNLAILRNSAQKWRSSPRLCRFYRSDPEDL